MSSASMWGLFRTEEYWRDHYHWLLDKGYQLRPRYHPEWAPPWKGRAPTLEECQREDYQAVIEDNVMDAIQIADDRHVVLKRVNAGSSRNFDELAILQYFSDEPRRSDPRNPCVPLLDVLYPADDETHVIVVFPVLRLCDDPEFDTVGEGLDFIRETLQGLVYLHEHGVVHNDIKFPNYMMDPTGLYTERFHCWEPYKTYDFSRFVFPQRRRTEAWPKYYIIDFGHSSRFRPGESGLALPHGALDKSTPEFEFKDIPCDFFLVDVQRFGNLIRMEFLDGNPKSSVKSARSGFSFLMPLIQKMTMPDPKDRPTMRDALELFDAIVSKTARWKLRMRVVPPPRGKMDLVVGPPLSKSIFRFCWRTLRYIAKGLPAMRPAEHAHQQNSEKA